VGGDDPAAVVYLDVFDEQAEEFFGLFGVFVGDDGFELVGNVVSTLSTSSTNRSAARC
jgi:hypothetical protein